MVIAVSVAAQSSTKFRGSREPTRRHSSVKVHCLSSHLIRQTDRPRSLNLVSAMIYI